MSTLKVNTIDSHSGSTLTIDSTADVVVASTTSASSNTTGALKVAGGISTQDNLYVGGNAVITGTMTANGGTITLGNADTDNVSFGGEVNSDVLPNTNNTFDLGSSSKKWAEVHATTLNGALTGDVTGNVTGNLTGNVTGNTSGSAGSCTGNAATASALETARTIGLSGDVSGSVSFDGSANATITATVADDSHNHTTANVDGLDSALAAKAPLASPALTGVPTAPTAVAGTDTTQVATTAFVGTAVDNLIGGAPGALDTLNELAAAINDDSSYASTITTSLGTKVDKVTGKALSANDFTDALLSKLNGIESGATADQTSEEIQDIVGGMVTGNTESGITVTYQDADGTLDFSVASQTDQNFTNADHSKLDGIEAGATADQTGAEIKAAYEGESNTNAFTDALLSKLNGIESGATADQTAEEIQDIAGAMWTGNSESGVSVTYQDADGTMDINVNDPTITLTGDVSGSATMTNLGNVSISATVANNSHDHTDKAPLASPALTGTPTAPTAAANTNNTQIATTAYVQTEITDLIGGAPGALDTLNELAAAINDDSSYASTVTSALGGKVATSSAQALSSAANAMTISGHTITLNRGDGTTDTVTVPDNNTTYSVGDGGLTQKNFTTTLKNKLDGIAASANNYSHPTHPGDDFSVDTGALTGATVVSDIDINVTTDTSGHVTDANGTVSTRNLTLADLGYTGATNANYITNNNQLTNGAGYITSYTNTTYSAGTGLDLSGTTFSIESDLREGGTGSDRYWGNTHDYIFADASHGLRFYTTGNEEMRLEDDGDLHVDGSVIAHSGTVSDERLKTGVSNIQNPLDKLDKINGVEFSFKKDGRRSAGVLAQEVEKVLPQAVSEKELPFEDGEKYKVVEYDALHALLIEAVKELRKEINILKGE